MSATPKATRDEFQYCARLGMTQAECARHLGISQAAVTKAKRRFGLTFSRLGAFQHYGKEIEMEYYRYPWERFEVGDWIRTSQYAGFIAWSANQRHAPKRFTSITRDGDAFVVRAA